MSKRFPFKTNCPIRDIAYEDLDNELKDKVNAISNRTMVTQSKSAPYNVQLTDDVVFCTGTITITLPTAASSTGIPFIVTNIGTGVITVAGASGTINGAADFELSAQYDSSIFVSNGANYFIVAGNA